MRGLGQPCEEYNETLNGRIVYKQMLPDDSPRKPYYIEWTATSTGIFQWVVAQGKDNKNLPKWGGEITAKCWHILTGNVIIPHSEEILRTMEFNQFFNYKL